MLTLLRFAISGFAVAAHAQIDPSIPLRGKTPQVQDPLETMRKAQEIRNIQLQNEQIRLQNEAIIKARDAVQSPNPSEAPSSLLFTPDQSNPPTLFAASPINERTMGMHNGRFWIASSDTARIFFLIGLNNATAAFSIGDIRKLYLVDNPPTFGETIKFIDSFYADPANAAILVLEATAVWAAKLNGLLLADLEAMTAGLRGQCAKPQGTPSSVPVKP